MDLYYGREVPRTHTSCGLYLQQVHRIHGERFHHQAALRACKHNGQGKGGVQYLKNCPKHCILLLHRPVQSNNIWTSLRSIQPPTITVQTLRTSSCMCTFLYVYYLVFVHIYLNLLTLKHICVFVTMHADIYNTIKLYRPGPGNSFCSVHDKNIKYRKQYININHNKIQRLIYNIIFKLQL